MNTMTTQPSATPNPGDKCPVCGKPEVDALTPRTVYACGSSDYDARPGTFKRGDKCEEQLLSSCHKATVSWHENRRNGICEGTYAVCSVCNKSCDAYSSHISSILETELAAVRAECERLKADGAATAFVDMSVRASNAESELARLRALFSSICLALGNGACCTTDVSIGFLEWIPNEVATVVARLRAEVELRKKDTTDLGMWVACKMLQPEWDSFKKSLEVVEYWKARAERAEAQLADHKTALEIANRSVDEQMRYKREAEAELNRLRPAARIVLEYQSNIDAVVALAKQHGCEIGSFNDRLKFIATLLAMKGPKP